MKYYIDTCVWMDFVSDREYTDIFTKCVYEEHTVVVSKILFTEIQRYLDYSRICVIIDLLRSKDLLFKAETSKEIILEAEKIALERDVPMPDALHAIHARDTDAVLVTRDRHFLKLKDLCTILLL